MNCWLKLPKIGLGLLVSLYSLTGGINWAEAGGLTLKATKQESSSKNQAAKVGKIEYGYDTPIDEQDRQVQVFLQKSQLFEAEIVYLNQIGFNLPQDVPIVWLSCRNIPQFRDAPANALFNGDSREPIIIMCYEIFRDAYNYFSKNPQQKSFPYQTPEANAVAATIMIMYHELGHALVALLDIPITGKEEDAVDDFAAYMLLEQHSNNAQLLEAGGHYLADNSNNSFYWDKHSFGNQRWANFVCIIFGSNPQKYLHLAEQTGLPESRAASCIRKEYPQKVDSWTKLIIPHLIPKQGNWGSNPQDSQPPANPREGWGD